MWNVSEASGERLGVERETREGRLLFCSTVLFCVFFDRFNLLFLISGVNFLSFSLPPDSGERITLVVTSLLTMTVFMLLVAEIMPPVSDVVPIISVYYVTAMFVVKSLWMFLL